jgi:hypothetical protein
MSTKARYSLLGYQSTPTRMRLSTQKERTCLGILPDGTYCKAVFTSPHPGVRFCPECTLRKQSIPIEDNVAPHSQHTMKTPAE